jgi:hypothetical protein
MPSATPPASDLCKSPERLDDDRIAELGRSRTRLVDVPHSPGRRKLDSRGCQKDPRLPVTAGPCPVHGLRKLGNPTWGLLRLVRKPRESPGRGLDLAVNGHAGLPQSDE